MKKYTYQTVLLFLLLTLIGGVLLPKLPVQLMPSNEGQTLTISFFWPGASPESIERQVTSRLEGVLSTLVSLRGIKSVSSYNQASITLELDPAADAENARFEVAQLLRQVYPKLPHDVNFAEISLNTLEQDDNSKPFVSLQLSGPASPGSLLRYAEEQLKPRLSLITGIDRVAVYGGTRPEWVISYDADILDALNLTETSLRQALSQYFQHEPLGRLRQQEGQSLNVELTNATQGDTINWRNIPITNQSGRIVYLHDLATISNNEPLATEFYRINGKTAVNIILSAKAGADQLTVVEHLYTLLPQLKLPPGYRLDVDYDSTVYIQENLHKIGLQTGVAVLALLVFVVLTTRSIHYVLLIAISTLVTLLLSVLAFLSLSTVIHIYSLVALTTSLGIVMDNFIIMIDHYNRYRNLKVFTALLGATLTTSTGLIVLWFLPEENRSFLTDFALTMVITLIVSLVVTVVFVPAMMKQFWPSKRSKGKKISMTLRYFRARRILKLEQYYVQLIHLLLRFRKTTILIGVLSFGLPVFLLPNQLETDNPLATHYNIIFSNNIFFDNVRPFLNKWLGGTLRLFVNYVYEGSYQQKPERTALYIIAELPNQSTPAQMEAVFRRFEEDISRFSQVDKYITQINNGQEGLMTIYFHQDDQAQSNFPYQLKNHAILLSTEMSGIDWNIFGVGQGFSQNINEDEIATFNIEMTGYNYRQLEVQAKLLAKLLENHPRTKMVNINRSPSLFQSKSLYEFQLETDVEQLALHNINTINLYDRLVDFNAHPQPDLYIFAGGNYETIRLQPKQREITDLWALQNRPFRFDINTLKLSQMSEISRQRVIPEIYKQDQQYHRQISFKYSGNYHLGESFLNKTLDKLNTQLPLGYSAKAINRFGSNQRERTPYEFIGLIVILVYMICAVTFESLWQPIALIILIPLSYIGTFVAFYLTDCNFDQGGYVSFVLLTGNVVCGGIYIVAEMNQLKKRYPRLKPYFIYIRAFRHKIGAVLLTVLSTVISMVPFLMYDREPFWFALSIGTIGGLLTSIFAIIFYLPIFVVEKNYKG